MLVCYVMCVVHNVCVMLGSSSIFLVSFCYVIMEGKVIIIVFITMIKREFRRIARPSLLILLNRIQS